MAWSFDVRCVAYCLAVATGIVATPIVPANAVKIELTGVGPDRVERQHKAALGQLPLPGTPDITQKEARLKAKDLKQGAPIFIRIFKAESELELWIEKGSTFRHFATYPICNWSGGLGPKQKEGDKQSPEGFYTVTRRQLHRRGRWPRALNLGYPNPLDRSLSRTGSYILVHGGCSSTGCFAMTDEVNNEIYKLAKAALKSRQQHIPIHVFPFRMTDEKLAEHAESKWHAFWSDLQAGYKSFETTRRPPQISVCNSRYQVRDAVSFADSGEPDETTKSSRQSRYKNAIQKSCEPPLPVATTDDQPPPEKPSGAKDRKAANDYNGTKRL